MNPTSTRYSYHRDMQATTGHSQPDGRKQKITESKFSLPTLLPADIIVLIVEKLSSFPTELFAPLVCSRVCSYWRQSVYETPSLWTFVDTLRGPRFTELWLTNSKQLSLDIRLSDQPLRDNHLEHTLLYSCLTLPSHHKISTIPESLTSQVHRWRSLDISFSCICRASKTLQFLGHLPETLHLDSLTIGPMGRANLVVDNANVRATTPHYPAVLDSILVPSYLRNSNVQPARLHVDTYPVFFNPHIFSPRLTLLEFFLGAHLAHDPDHVEWHTILSSVPNLAELSLWDHRYKGRRDIHLPQQRNTIELGNLKTLKLSGRFIHFVDMIVMSSLPSLRFLLLDSLDTAIATLPMYLSKVALVSPALSHVSIGSMCHAPKDANVGSWAQAFRPLRATLRELTFVETEWREVLVALDQLISLPHTMSCLRLERVWDMETYDWDTLRQCDNGIPIVELVDCLDGSNGWCSNDLHEGFCESADGSNCELRTLAVMLVKLLIFISLWL